MVGTIGQPSSDMNGPEADRRQNRQKLCNYSRYDRSLGESGLCRHNVCHNQVLFEKEHKMASEKQGQMSNEAVIYTPAIEGPYIALLVDLE